MNVAHTAAGPSTKHPAYSSDALSEPDPSVFALPEPDWHPMVLPTRTELDWLGPYFSEFDPVTGEIKGCGYAVAGELHEVSP